MNTKELSVTDAVKTFSSEMGTPVRALNSVNLTIPTGSHVAIMGPSGSGKSTLLHCMSGILPLDAGTVMFAGTNLAALREKQRSKIRREHMGFVFQDGALLPELTNEENVAMPLLLAGMSLPSALPHAREWLVRLGLADAARRRPGQISGGQAQRVAIARAMVASPAVVFADEPTGRPGPKHGSAGDAAADSGVHFYRRHFGAGYSRRRHCGLVPTASDHA